MSLKYVAVVSVYTKNLFVCFGSVVSVFPVSVLEGMFLKRELVIEILVNGGAKVMIIGSL